MGQRKKKMTETAKKNKNDNLIESNLSTKEGMTNVYQIQADLHGRYMSLRADYARNSYPQVIHKPTGNG